LEAVRESLVLLLNTRQGAVEHLPDYGMPILEAYQPLSPESMASLAAELELVLRRYEPRIQDLEIKLTPSDSRDFLLSFSIAGTIVDDLHGPLAVEFMTMVTENGRAEVEQ
jgi:type VI secretion system protein